MKRLWLFIFVTILLMSTNAFASRLSILPNPGVSTLNWHFTRTDANFIELYRLIFASESGFVGLSGNIITSGMIGEQFISGDIARVSDIDGFMRSSDFDNDSDSFIDDEVIPAGIARSSAITLLLDAKMTRSIYDADMNNFIDDGVLPATIARTSTVNTALNLKANASDVPTTSAMNTALSGKQNADLDLDDLADGSLTGSKVGTGISAGNVSTGILPDAVIPAAIARDAEITSALGSYTTTSALTTLLAGKMGTATGTPDGTKFLRDDLTWQPHLHQL